MKWFKEKRTKTIMTCIQHFQKFSSHIRQAWTPRRKDDLGKPKTVYD